MPCNWVSLTLEFCSDLIPAVLISVYQWSSAFGKLLVAKESFQLTTWLGLVAKSWCLGTSCTASCNYNNAGVCVCVFERVEETHHGPHVLRGPWHQWPGHGQCPVPKTCSTTHKSAHMRRRKAPGWCQSQSPGYGSPEGAAGDGEDGRRTTAYLQ